MCIKSQFIWVKRGPVWEKQNVPCRKCWQCKKNRLNDYVGRCLAEASVSDWTRAITLTYRDTAAAEKSEDRKSEHVLTQRHFQEFIRSVRKPMRKRGHVLRYLAVGEYGKLKGRAHFHALLFGQGKPPQIPLRKNYHIPQWPHGHVYMDGHGDEKTIRYVAKYLLKDDGDSWFTCSKYPPLGDAYFAKLAQRNVELGVWPTSFQFLPPGGQSNWRYPITGVSRRNLILRLIAGHGGVPYEKLSEWTRQSVEKVERWMFEQEVRPPVGKDARAGWSAWYLERLLEELKGRDETEAQRFVRWAETLYTDQYRATTHGIEVAEREADGEEVEHIKAHFTYHAREAYSAAAAHYGARPQVHGEPRASVCEGDHAGACGADADCDGPDAWR